MMKTDKQILREWLAETPGEFTINEAMEATGISRSRLAFLFNSKGMAEMIGHRTLRCKNRGHYSIKVYRRAGA